MAASPDAGPMTGRLFGLGAAMALCVALLNAADRPSIALLGVLVALGFGVGIAITRRGQAALAVQGVAWATALAAVAAGCWLGTGVRAMTWGFVAVLIGLVCRLAGKRAAIALAVGSALLMVAMAAAELSGLLAVVPTTEPLGRALAIRLLWILGGLASGLMMAQAVDAATLATEERERRFRGLLHIAADWYWEQDAELRFTHVSDAAHGDDRELPLKYRGKTRWEIDGLEMLSMSWDEHRRELEARRPFRDLLVRRPGPDGQPVYLRVSGEPVFDGAGQFRGYWGVGRNVDAEMGAQRALHASEERYRELFERSPSPMLLHRGGQILDANEAALSLFGYPDRAAALGQPLLHHYPPGLARDQLARRLAAAERLQPGEHLPLAEFRLERCDGRLIDTQVTTLRVQLEDGPATLSIYVDHSAHMAAEQALRRSRTLLMQLFATTPDTVTLSELKSGKYLMLNRRFTELLGWTEEEATGRSALELGIWHRPADRERMIALLEAQGSVHEMPALFGAKSGPPVPLNVSAARFTLDGIDYLVVVGRDMADAEKARLEREAILQHASIGIAFTRDRRFVHCNPKFEEIFGWPHGEMAGQLGSVVWPDDQAYAEIGRIAGPLLSAGRPFEIERQVRRRDGSLFWARMRARVVDPSDPSRGGTIWIGEDVTERRQFEQSLAAARDAAEAASRAKSAFLANTSHEIRTPLNGLLGLARLLQQPELGSARRQQYVDQIIDSAQGLAAIINDILDVSKIEAGKLALESRPLALHALIQTTCQGYQALAEERGLRLSWHIDASVPEHVLGDALRLRQILGNFVSNALKFTDAGSVRVEATRSPQGTLRLVVSDTGPGIAAATQQRLFRPFTQADDSITRRYGGTGLGLAICRELATLMGGAVGVDSEPGQGSRFWAELPLTAAECAAPAGDDAAPAQPLHGARVLVVEDNPVNMLIVRAMLEAWGVQVTEAVDGQQAVDVVAAAQQGEGLFDAVLMDVQMPRMSGLEATRRLRERHDRTALPIIALTAAALVSERDHAIAAGMNAFLTKPIDVDELRRTLAQVLARQTTS